jgi:hypothetical protein
MTRPRPARLSLCALIDLGRTDDPGGDILNVNGAGTLIDNGTAASLIALGNHGTVDGAPPGPVIAGFVERGQAPNLDIVGGVFVLDDEPHPASATVTRTGGVDLGRPNVTYVYQDGDGAWVPTANGGTAPPVDPGYYRAKAVFVGTNDYQAATATADITIAYAVRSLTDLSAAFKAGRTIPIKLQLLDADGINVSSATIAVAALRLERVNAGGTRTMLPATASGNTNPVNLFRYDATLGGYIFNLSTKDLSAGTYDLVWIAGDDPTEHRLRFSLN